MRSECVRRVRDGTRPLGVTLVLVAVLASGCLGAFTPASPVAEPVGASWPGVDVVTDHGTMTLVLYPERMPASVAHFLGFVADGFYDGRLWERVVDNFVIQSEDKEGDPQETLPLETHPDVHFAAGTLGFARDLDEDSATHVFFITEYPQPHLHEAEGSTLVYGEFAAFGQLVAGWDVLRAVAAEPVDANDRPERDVRIRAVTPVNVTMPGNASDVYPLQVADRVSVPPYRVSLEHQRVLRASEPVQHFRFFVESQVDRAEDTGLALEMRFTAPSGEEVRVPLEADPADGNVHAPPADFAFPEAGAYEVRVGMPPTGVDAVFSVRVG